MAATSKWVRDQLKDRYAVRLQSTPCPYCGSLQLCAVSTQSDGKPLLTALCIRCGHSAKLPRVTIDDAPNVNRLSKWASIVKARDDYRCVICGSDTNVEAHHIIPKDHDRNNVWVYEPNNGITVCRRCHELIHGQWMSKYRKDYEH